MGNDQNKILEENQFDFRNQHIEISMFEKFHQKKTGSFLAICKAQFSMYVSDLELLTYGNGNLGSGFGFLGWRVEP